MYQTSLNTTQHILLIAALALLLLSVYRSAKQKYVSAVGLLFLSGLFLNLFMAMLDPFLNDWDERFHALVAKNVMHHPFRPMLFTQHPIPYNYFNWTDNEVWIHKQPLFLWQIACFFKMFDVNEFVLRLPSVLMGAILIPVIFRMGKLLFDANSGYVSAFIYTLSIYHLEMIAGVQGVDHNTFAFVFYVTLSVWCWLEYIFSGKIGWMIAVGLFAGGAVLNKWLIGLWVFGAWGIVILADKKRRNNLKSYIHAAISFGIAILVFLPWQIYTRWKFPLEFKSEMDFNNRHFFEELEGHGGTVWYYFENLYLHYGNYLVWLFPLAILLFLIRAKSKIVAAALLVNVGVVFFFFSVLVMSKLAHFTYMVSGVAFLVLGVAAAALLSFIKKKLPSWHLAATFIILFAIGYDSLNFEKIAEQHITGTKNYYGYNAYRDNKIYNTELFKRLPTVLQHNNYVFFNCKLYSNIEMSFYSGFRGYAYIPDSVTIENLKLKGYKIAVFNTDIVPEFLRNDSEVLLVNDVWK